VAKNVMPEDAIILRNLWRNKRTGKRYWRCVECGRCDTWRKGWAWFGSFRDLDDGFVCKVLCPDCGVAQDMTKTDSP
jgi:hypothetical protein